MQIYVLLIETDFIRELSKEIKAWRYYRSRNLESASIGENKIIMDLFFFSRNTRTHNKSWRFKKRIDVGTTIAALYYEFA